MALEKVGGQALVIAQQQKEIPASRVPKKKILDEEEYTEGLEKIIERDFFPDLAKLQAQNEYLEALQKNDTEKLRQIHAKYGPKRGSTKTPSIYSTPATFETPVETPGGGTPSHTLEKKDGEKEITSNPEKPTEKNDSNVGLDKFLATNTSEDNASFVVITKEAEKKHKIKHAWLYEQESSQEQAQQAQLALPSIQQQAVEYDGNKGTVQTWKYQVKNTVMYIPEGCDDSSKEKIDKARKPREILHKNTRFTTTPFNVVKNQQTIQQAASLQALGQLGKYGPDGKEIIPAQSPKVNGFGFVATPSPAPGVDDSPMMTWGEIEGTPFRLDGGGTPLMKTLGPTFKIPDVPKRDRLLMDLAEKASKQHRAKKQQALKRVTASLSTPSPKFGSAGASDRLHSLSPAAQRLASTKLGIRTNTDKALRASYSPSPSHRLPGDKTPTPKRSPLVTPKSGVRTPKIGTAPKRDIDSGLLTDDLLNLPKRKKAADFF